MTEGTEAAATTPGQDFHELLETLREGLAVEEAGERLQELIKAVQATGKGGALAFTIKVEPADKADSTLLRIVEDITVRAPKPSKRPVFLFGTKEGRLSQRDPRQMELAGLKEVDPEKVRRFPATQSQE